MRYRIAAAAEQELDEAVEWYRQQQEGLQMRFLVEFRSTIARIQAQPVIYQELRPGIRRALMRRFPYSVIYEISDDAMLILAIAHLHRRPFYWASGSVP
jgi:plasmid stabilization system protein ParE